MRRSSPAAAIALTLAGTAAFSFPAPVWAVQVKPLPAAPTPVEIGFSTHPGGPSASAVVAAPGRTPHYRVVLEPDYDADKRPIGINLQLCRVGVNATCGLLQPRGGRRTIFLASEFVNPARPPLYGRKRTFVAPRLGLSLEADATAAMVTAMASRSGKPAYGFETLRVRVVVRDTRARH